MRFKFQFEFLDDIEYKDFKIHPQNEIQMKKFKAKNQITANNVKIKQINFKFNYLKYLDLDSNNILNFNIKAPNLEFLSLINNKLSNLSFLKNHLQLKFLYLSFNLIDDE